MLPDEVLRQLASGAKVVEVGVGARWETILELHAVRPDLVLVATDLKVARLRGSPAFVRPAIDDVARPDRRLYAGAALVYGERVPEELQVPIARIARDVGAVLAFTVVKDEVADLGDVVGPARIVQDAAGRAWRVHDPKG